MEETKKDNLRSFLIEIRYCTRDDGCYFVEIESRDTNQRLSPIIPTVQKQNKKKIRVLTDHHTSKCYKFWWMLRCHLSWKLHQIRTQVQKMHTKTVYVEAIGIEYHID